jgi:hypothetical protein
MAMILSFFFSLLIAWLVLRNIERALLIAVVLTLIFVALNYLYYVTVYVVMHLYGVVHIGAAQ